MVTISVSVDRNGFRLINELASGVRAAANEAVVKTTEEAKRATKDAVSAGLKGRRVGNLIGSELYFEDENGELATVGYTHSRWFRAPKGGQTLGGGSGLSPGARLKANDVLALHATGGTITPGEKNWLRISKLGGVLKRRARLDYRDPDIDVVPVMGRSGQTILLVFDRRGGQVNPGKKARRLKNGKLIEILVPSVTIPQRIDMIPVVKHLENRLLDNVTTALAKRQSL
jgi:hypothetical protein